MITILSNLSFSSDVFVRAPFVEFVDSIHQFVLSTFAFKGAVLFRTRSVGPPQKTSSEKKGTAGANLLNSGLHLDF